MRFFVLAGILLFASVAAADEVPLKSENDRLNYSIGYQIGGDFVRQEIDLNVEAIVQGIRDAVAKNQPQVPQEQMTELLVNLKKRLVTEQRQMESQTAKAFLEANRKKKGVVETASGVQYRVLKAGSGAKPADTDTVAVNIRTSDINGRVISSSFESGQPRTYQVNKLNQGLQEVLPLMHEGDRWEVVIPAGHRGGRDGEYLERIGPIIYEIELIQVTRPEAAGSAKSEAN